MTEEETIIEGNKLIAEFMEINVKIEEAEKKGGEGYKACRYHQSWDWLMPSVRKTCNEISELGFDKRGSWNPELGYSPAIYSMQLNTPIHEVWNSLVAYIIKKNKTILKGR